MTQNPRHRILTSLGKGLGRPLFYCVAILFCFFYLSSTVCGEKDSGTPENFSAAGTVRFIDLEGGFYGIEGNDGEHYDPMNLPEDYQEDGLKIQFQFEESKGMASTRMWGRIIKLNHLERTSDSNSQSG